MIKSKRITLGCRIICLPALAGMLLWAPCAYAQSGPQFSAAYMRELCKNDPNGNETVKGGHAACQAYIAGVLDYHGTLRALGTEPSLSICFPGKTPPIYDLQKIVWRYIDKNPPVDAFAAAPTVIMALSAAYPCKKKR